MRQQVRLRDGWTFTRVSQPDAVTADCDDSGWEPIQVPHDWAIAGPFDKEHDIERKVDKGHVDVEKGVHEITGRTGALPHMGEGWYRTWVHIPEGVGKCYRLECDGIMSHSTVYCNGHKVGGWPYGYTSFALDLTAWIEPGTSNLIAVHVNNPAKSSRWYPGAGIYRNVRFLMLDTTHIDYCGVAITTPVIDVASGRVCIKTSVVGVTAMSTVRSTIVDPEGRIVASWQCPASAVTEQILEVNMPQRWTLETPVQYTVRSEILEDDEVKDVLVTRFGFRTLRFDVAKGFFLNEEPVKLQGVCMHHDLGPLGAAVNIVALRRQLTILKEMGCNAIRTSHNPPAPELPALASEMGILIIDEVFDEWKHQKMLNGYHTLWDDWAEKDVRALIRRDRNHPSVIMWSTGNELYEQWKDDGPAISQFLVDICHDEDPTRPVTAGLNHFESEIAQALASTVDIPGWNYRPHSYGHFRMAFPDKPTYGSETASTVSSRGEYYFPIQDEIHMRRDTLQVNSYDLSYAGWATAPDVEFQAQDAHPFVMGEFVWTGFDYLGEPTPYAEEWPSRSSYFGIVDLGGLPKDRFYLYQSRWSQKDVLHLMPHWTWPGYEGKPIPVQCYSNFDHLELFVNGVSQGRRGRYPKGRVLESNYRFIWQAVPYEEGELKVVAYDKSGAILAETRVLTAGAPAAIQLLADRNRIVADGDDMVFVTVRIVDKNGTLCPHAEHTISYRVDGPGCIAGLCNGDATSLESFKGNEMKVFHGQAVVYLRSKQGDVDTLTLSAACDGLPPARAEFEVH